jgi:hypothetical protein
VSLVLYGADQVVTSPRPGSQEPCRWAIFIIRTGNHRQKMRPRITTGTRRRSSSRQICGWTSIKGAFALRSLSEQNRFASAADVLGRSSAPVAGSFSQDGRIRTARRPRYRETMLRDQPEARRAGSPIDDSMVAYQAASISKLTTPRSYEVIAQGSSTMLDRGGDDPPPFGKADPGCRPRSRDSTRR